MKQINLYLTIGIVLIISSCATMVNGKYTTVEINSTPSNATVIVNGADSSKRTPAVIAVPRSKERLYLTIKKDSLCKDIVLKSKLSTAFWFGNTFSGIGLIGHAIDLTNQKRFQYDKEIFVDLNSNSTKYSRWLVDENIPINWTISLPHVNQYYIKRTNDHSHKFGFYGFSTGFEYYMDKTKYLSFQIGAAINFPNPIPFVISYLDDNETCSSVFGNIKYNNKINKLHLGYGLQFSRLSWRKTETDDIYLIISKELNNTIGLSLTCYYQFWKRFYIGAILQPSFITLNNEINIDYQHYIGIDFAWKFKLYNFKEK